MTTKSTPFKNKFASLISDLRESKKAVYGKKFTEFSKQPYPAYSDSYGNAAPPPPPPVPQAAPHPATQRPPSRSGSIRNGFRRIGSRASLRRRGSSAAASTTSVDKIEASQVSAQSKHVEITPPPSDGKPSPILRATFSTQNVNLDTPPTTSDPYDSDEDLYSDPTKSKREQVTRNALPQLQTSIPSEDAARSQQTQSRAGLPRINPSMLPTIPASPATTMHSPVSPTGDINPFRKLTPTSPNLGQIANGPFKPEAPKLDTLAGSSSPPLPQPASPETATVGLMNGLPFTFHPPPSPRIHSPITSTPTTPPLADNNPFKGLLDDVPAQETTEAGPSRVKAIMPIPSSHIPGVLATKRAQQTQPPPVPARTEFNGAPLKQPQFKRAPTALKSSKPDNFVPPPPPPMALPKGWTARWDDTEQRFIYFQGTRGRDEQYEMPTEPAKKLSMRDRRLGKKKAVQNAVARLPSYEEANSPTSPHNSFPPKKQLVRAGGSS